jgi:hypothetical protein
MKVRCINSSNKPSRIPLNEWLVEGEEYTVVDIKKMGLTPNTYGFLLKEVQLSEKSFPYELYNTNRFQPIELDTLEEVNILEADLSII